MSLWPNSKRDLTWRIIDIAPGLTLNQQRALTDQSLASWDRRVDERCLFTFREVKDDFELSDFDIGTIMPSKLPNPLAYAIRGGTPGSGLKPITYFNTRYDWSAAPYPHVCCHEAGHIQGRDGESPNSADLMYGETTPGNASLVAPQLNDINWLRVNYSLPPIGVPTVPTAQQSAVIAFASPPPASVPAGSTFQVSLTVTNDGLADWQPENLTGWTVLNSPQQNGLYALGDSRNDKSPWGFPRWALPGVVRSGQTFPMTVGLVAPQGWPAQQTLRFQIVCENDKWIGNELFQAITVTPADQPQPPVGPPKSFGLVWPSDGKTYTYQLVQ